MAGFQFAHIEVYARSPSKLKGARRADEGEKREKGTGGWTARQVLAEALREDGACPHVAAPQQPEVLLGNLEELAAQIEAPATVKGLRKDAPILLAGVISAPWPPGDERGVLWRMDAIEHLRAEFGDRLQVVVAHNDEAFDHMHFYVTAPDLGAVKPLHPGFAARAKAADDDKSAKDQALAYEAAMRAWQDRYHEVARRHGMARHGPRRARLSTAAWNDQQRQAEQLQRSLDDAAAINGETARKLADLEERQQRLIGAEAKFAIKVERIEKERSALHAMLATVFDKLPSNVQKMIADAFSRPAPAASIAPAKEPAGTIAATPAPRLKPKI